METRDADEASVGDARLDQGATEHARDVERVAHDELVLVHLLAATHQRHVAVRRRRAARRGATHRLNQRRRPANLTLTLTTTTILTREKNGGVAEAALEGTAASGATKAIEGDAGSAGSAGGAKKKGKKRRAAR